MNSTSLRTQLLAVVSITVACAFPAPAALQAVTNPGAHTSPGGTVAASVSMVGPFTITNAEFLGELGGVLSGGNLFHRSADDPSVVGPSCVSSAPYYNDPGGYSSGAIEGDDNWIYICREAEGALVFNGWVRVVVTPTSLTPIYYIYDSVDTTVPITLPQALAVAPPPIPRDIQIKSLDFESFVIELHNYGLLSQTLTGWRFCTHDDDQTRRYSPATGLNGITIEGGTSFYIWFNNNAPVVDSNNINRSGIGGGGGWATPLDRGPYGMGLFFAPVNFGDGNTMADNVQWSLGGADNASADERSDEAQSAGVWTNQALWVATSDETTKFVLTDPSGGTLHGPVDYLVLPDFTLSSFVFEASAAEAVFTWPIVNNLAVTVETSTTLLSESWSGEATTTNAGATLTGQSDDQAFYRLSYQLP